ncbi:MAG: DNA primase [Pseudomonadota bacterium]
MRFPDSFLDDIRNRLPISEVIGQRVSFDKKKTNAARGDYWACCPFHGEKTPSFHCEDRKGRYYCFGCGVSGDHFRFLTELDGLSFHEAVERLAAQAGLPMPVMDAKTQEREEKRKSLFDVMALAAQFFQEQLHSGGGAKARAYLRDRGLSPAIQQEFGLGFAPESRNALKQFLAEKGVEAKQMEDCGLLVHGEDIAVSFDRFRDRIMFPIEDDRGRVIAFGGRALKADAMAKYLNSPETELFHKSDVLYNFGRARRSKQNASNLIVVEGYMDVIALHAVGIENAVAPLGTALTENHIGLLWRAANEPVLCFDGDQAGVRAANRATDLILPRIQTGKSVKYCLLPEGYDPDDYVKEKGAKAFLDHVTNSVPLSEYVLVRRMSGVMMETPEQKALIEKQIFADLAQIKDPVLAKYFNTHARFRLIEGFGLGRRNQQKKGASKPGAIAVQGQMVVKDPVKRCHRIILGLCVEYPYLFADYIEEIADVNFELDGELNFVSELYRLFIEDADILASKVYDRINPTFFETLEKYHGNEVTELAEYIEKHGSLPWSLKRGHKLIELFPMLQSDPPPFLVRETLELHLLEENREDMQSHVDRFNYDNSPEMGLQVLEEFTEVKSSYEHKLKRVDSLYQLHAGRDHLVDEDFRFDNSLLYDMGRQQEVA